MAVLLGVEDVGRQIGARPLFGHVSFQVRSGDRIALVGPNGAGKSTLLRILCGDDPPDEGRVIRPRRSCIERLRQEIDPAREVPVRDEAATALAHLAELEVELGELEQAMARAGERGEPVSDEVAERYDQVRSAFEHGGGFAREARVETVLAGLGFDEEARGRPLSRFSGGWLMRVELAKLLLAEPDVLLLDEPTNHLDLPAIQWFEETLADFPGGVVVVSHDRAFLRRHARRVVELDGAGRFNVYEGSYDRYLAQRAQRREELLARQRNQDREIAHMERFVERFRAKASKAKQAQSRLKALEKVERIEVEPDRRARMRLRIPEPARTGEIVMTLSDIHKSYGDTEVYRGVDLEIRRGDRVALVGPNGAGKSTLLRIVAGALPFDSGERTPGHNVQVAFYAQHQLETLDPDNHVLGELEAVARTDDVPRLRGHLGAFLFSGDDVEKKVSVLSGGEKARLALARMLLRPANFLVLDEPTNHLDVEACEVLEDALSGFGGTVAFISHDREFINAIASRVVEVKDGELREFLGNYDDYLRKSSGSGGAADAGAAPRAGGDAGAPPADPKAARQRDRARRKARERAQRQIARLEESILEEEKQIESAGWELGTPEVYRDAERTRETEARREALRASVAERYREWERLAEELEELGDET
ncbi:MAG: ABC-F family ATP-binding cassette domain-containing protein [Myxococcota bacterium]